MLRNDEFAWLAERFEDAMRDARKAARSGDILAAKCKLALLEYML